MVIWQQGRKVPLAWSLLLLYTLGTNNSCSVLTLPNHRHSLPEDPHSTSTPPQPHPLLKMQKFFQNQNIWSYFRTKLWIEVLRFKPRSLAWWHLVGNIIRYDIKESESTCLRLSHSTLEPCQAGRSLCTRDSVGCHGYKCQQGYACPGIFQTTSPAL